MKRNTLAALADCMELEDLQVTARSCGNASQSLAMMMFASCPFICQSCASCGEKHPNVPCCATLDVLQKV
jgi:hypothetical protein